jgi:SWI/SNF-related matrix-associated actin-dependent regulator 1 of chromatin subfamily A
MTGNTPVLGMIRVLCEKQGRKQLYRLYFPYNQILIDKIKSFPKDEREWKGDVKAWDLSTIALFSLLSSFKKGDGYWFDFGSTEGRQKFIDDIQKIKDLEEEKKRVIAEIEQKNKEAVEFKEYIEAHTEEFVERIHEKIKEPFRLYAFQVAGVMFLDKVKNALLAFEMGLGKTLSSIAYVEYSNFEKVLVVTPNSLKFNYYNEVEKFTFSKAHIINWKGNWNSIQDSKYIIVNYDYFRDSDWNKVLAKFKLQGIDRIDAVICDESQKLKNSKANTTKNFDKLLKLLKPKSKVFLSGTPTPNRAYELYTVLHQISPIEFATKQHFYEYYCGMSFNRYTNQYDTDVTAARFEELFRKTAPHIYRKRKIDVLDLPDKVYSKTLVELTPKEIKAYELTEAGIANEVLGEDKVTSDMIITIMLRLRQFTAKIKLPLIQELVESILEGGEKVVVLDMFKEPLYELKNILGDIAAVHTGDQSVEDRQELVKKFQDPESNLKVFLGSIQTCNYGLTLTAASKMIIITLPYSVGEYDQATDRIHRIGTKNTVFIYPVIAQGTIDEMVFQKLESKRWEISKVIDNENYESKVNESVFSEIVKHIRSKYVK